MRKTVLDAIRKNKLIAIVRSLPPDQMMGLAQSFLEGGLKMMEITFDQSKPETWTDTAAAIRMLNGHFSGRLLVGAGTVLSLQQLRMAHEAGAQYIISPNVNESVIQETLRLGLVSLPGAMTPTEIVAAHLAGADMVKVFPVGELGPGYIRSLCPPLSHIPLLAVGGVNEKNAADFLASGAVGLGVGGSLVNRNWIANGEFHKITALAREYVAAVGAAEH